MIPFCVRNPHHELIFLITTTFVKFNSLMERIRTFHIKAHVKIQTLGLQKENNERTFNHRDYFGYIKPFTCIFIEIHPSNAVFSFTHIVINHFTNIVSNFLFWILSIFFTLVTFLYYVSIYLFLCYNLKEGKDFRPCGQY